MGKLIDLTGQSIGRWKVSRRAENLYGRHVAWLCKCACGTERVVAAKALRSGLSTSCGCAKRDRGRARLIDLSGRTFGRLYVIDSHGAGRSLRWRCRCLCGNYVLVRGQLLRDGQTQSCGCLFAEGLRQRNSANAKSAPGYVAAHSRVRKSKGPAREHRCLDCGERAENWSYKHGDPDELVTPSGLRYSTKVDYYEPRCVPCHRKYDKPTQCGGALSTCNHPPQKERP